MGIVVQKYGGSSCRRRRRRSSASRNGSSRPSKQGHDVVVVVSAMGDSTDELLDLANDVSPLPPARELDMLLTAGERISMALVAMAIADLGFTARSFTGSQAGVITDSAHGKAKIIDITPGRIDQGPRRRPHRDRGRLPGRQPGHQGDHHAGPRRLRHHRGRARRRPGRRGLRDLHRRRRRLHRRPSAGAHRPPARPRLHRGDAGDGGLRREDPAPALRGVRPPLRHPGPRPLLLLPEGRHLDPARPTGGSRPMEQAIIAGIAHDRSEAKITVVGVPDKLGEAARIFEALADAEINIDMVVQNISAQATGLTDISFTLPREDGQTAMAALAKLRERGRLRPPDVRRPDRQGVADRRRHALAPGRLGEVLRRPRQRRRQHRDDLHLGDPDLGDRRRGRRQRGGPGDAHRVRPRQRRGRGGRLRRDRR